MLVSWASSRVHGHQDEVTDTYRGAFLILKMSQICAPPCALEFFGTKDKDKTPRNSTSIFDTSYRAFVHV